MLSDFEREKSSSTRFTPNGVYYGIVKRVDFDANSVWVELPRVVTGYQFGPLVVSAATLPRVGAKVSCMFIEDRMDDLVVLGISLDLNSPHYIIPASCLSTDKPVNPEVGQIIWETNTGGFYVWNGTIWTSIAALTATRLATARSIALSGDISGSVAFDGSVDVTITNALTAAALVTLDARYVNHSEYATTGSILYASAAGVTTPRAIGTAGLPLVAGATVPDYAALELAGLATAVQNLLIPAGTVIATVGATADTGYLLLDGTTSVGAQSAFPALWARAPASWKVGAPNLALPDARGRTLFMDDSAALFTLGGVGGANTVVIASGNLPVHTHDLSSHTHTLSSHTHTTGDGGSHRHAAATSGDGVGLSNRTTNPDSAGTAGWGFSLDGGATTGYWTSSLPTSTIGNHNHGTSGAPSNNTSGAPSNNASGNGAFANTALGITNAHLTINWQIKAH